MRTTKQIALMGVYLALLIAGQYLLSFVAVVEIVTVLMVAFCFYFGILRGMTVATLFSLLRCFIFGFAPNVIVLYLVYYNLLALVFGLIGRLFAKKVTILKVVLVVVISCVMTATFTLLDNVITPLMLNMSSRAWQAYAYASVFVLAPQVICTLVSVAVLFVPIVKSFSAINI